MLIPQRLEDDCLVDAVHELRRKLAPRRFDSRALNFVVERLVHLNRLGRESKAAIHQVRHLACPQVRGQNDDALRKIHAPVIAQRQCRLVQNSQQ